MKRIRLDIRFSEKEKQKLRELAATFGTNVSDYVKNKVFYQNPDLIDEDEKYICPNSFKQAYFLAFSQIKALHLLKQIFIKQKGMDSDDYQKFVKHDYDKIADDLSQLGYRKIKKKKDE